MKNLINALAAAFAFCFVAACVEPAPAAELNIDNVKRIMKNGADLSGGSLTNTKTTATFNIVSNTADATTSSTVAPITLKAGADITAADLLLDVQDSSGNHAFKVTEAGAATALTSLTATTTVNATTDMTIGGNDLTATGTGQTFNIVSAANDTTVTASVAAITLSTSVDVTAGDLVLAVRDSAASALMTIDEEGDTGVKGRLSSAGTATCADSGDGNPGTLTLNPAQNFVYVTVSDAHGCTVTMGETDAINGSVVTIVNASTPVANFADTSGVSETTGAIALGQYDSLTLVYAADRWVMVSTSDN